MTIRSPDQVRLKSCKIYVMTAIEFGAGGLDRLLCDLVSRSTGITGMSGVTR